MTFQNAYAVDGGTYAGPILRLMQQAASRGGEGIIEIGDLRVEELEVPGTSIRVRDGACMIRGKEVLWQGSYFGYNLGDTELAITATDGGGGRSDLIVAQIEDPTISGSPWGHDPATDPLVYARVIEGVAPGTTTVPAGLSAIPLARIDIPVSTGTITQDMIVDLREMMDARIRTELRTVQGGGDDTVGNIVYPDWEAFPNGANWDFDVPTWCSQVSIQATWAQLDHISANEDAYGHLRAKFGDLATPRTLYNVDWVGTPTRHTMVAGGTLTIPEAMRGTTQTLEFQGARASTGGSPDGRLEADAATAFMVIVTFREVPVYDVPDRSPH